MKQSRSKRLLVLAAGFTLWASAFLMLYGLNAVGCAFGWPQQLHRGVLLAVLALHLAALGWLTWHCWQRRRDGSASGFLEYVGLGAAVAAMAATLLTFSPSLVLTLCD